LKIKVTESDRMVMLADSEGWPNIVDNDSSVIVKQRRMYVYWRQEKGAITYASDNLGPLNKPYAPAVESFIRGARKDQDFARRAGLTVEGR
jgi:hypothetical protein